MAQFSRSFSQSAPPYKTSPSASRSTEHLQWCCGFLLTVEPDAWGCQRFSISFRRWVPGTASLQKLPAVWPLPRVAPAASQKLTNYLMTVQGHWGSPLVPTAGEVNFPQRSLYRNRGGNSRTFGCMNVPQWVLRSTQRVGNQRSSGLWLLKVWRKSILTRF